MRRTFLVLFVLHLGLCTSVRGAGNGDFQPDPKSVQRYGPAYRYPQAGWIVLHIEGEPYERGYQHGRLLAPEIAAQVRCAAAYQNFKAPNQGWKQARTLVNALFLRRYDKEYLEEMKGIADGASAAGARFDHRPIDLVDIVGVNAWPEIETLDSALNSTATGLEGMAFPHAQPRAMPSPKPMHCSAFAATGPATADGKIVFGHITMFSLYPSLFYNVWLDVKPAKGFRVLMQSYPGGIQSGLDYYINSAGLLVCETTIAQTTFDAAGLTIASRIRKALQYADSIDKAVDILKKGNNGLYTNEWLLADLKTNEIAMFELGTRQSRLYRSSKNEWYGGTEGFYWGANNTKDLQVRLETVASVKGRPANVVFHPAERDRFWLRLYHEHKGKIDASFGKLAFTTPPIAYYHSVDAKFTTTDLARQLKTWALFGPPLGRSWQPTQDERDRFDEIRPLVSNPWAILHAQPPAKAEAGALAAADLPDRVTSSDRSFTREDPRGRRHEYDDQPPPAWHGTLLPHSDADTWLAAAFADYHKMYAREKEWRKDSEKKELSARRRDRLAVALYGFRSNYLAAARSGSDTSLDRTQAELARDEWYRVAAGKGLLVLQELRRLLGDEKFEAAMDAFGREHAGKEVTAKQFQDHMEKVFSSKDYTIRNGDVVKSFQAKSERADPQRIIDFFANWLKQSGLPELQLKKVQVKPLPNVSSCYQVAGEIHRRGPVPPQEVDVTIESAAGEGTGSVLLRGPVTRFNFFVQGSGTPAAAKSLQEGSHVSIPLPPTLKLVGEPIRVIVDKYGRSARANGGVFSTLSFHAELDKTLIVYGTANEAPMNRETADTLQKAIVVRGSNFTVPIKSDKEITEDELRTHHLLLIGRPDSNSLVERFRAALPVPFGSRSFVVRGKSYAHARSAVIVAAENPLNRRFSLVVLAGMSAEATLGAVPHWMDQKRGAGEVLLLAHGSRPQALVLPARDLVVDVPKP